MSKRKSIAAVLGIAVLSTVAVSRANVLSITDTPPVNVSGTLGTDYLIWQQVDPTQLTMNNSASVLSVLSGTKTQTSPGGNVRLYANSDGAPFATFQTAPHIILSGTIGGHSIAVSSVDGNDWFTTPTGYNTSFGANNLANQWFNSFLSNYNFSTALTIAGYSPSQVVAQEAVLYTGFLNYNGTGGQGYQHLSGPSVSYVQEDTTAQQVNIGIADTDNYLGPLVTAYVDATGNSTLIAETPADTYASKVVGISVDGGPDAFEWSFNHAESGLATTDGTNSDNLEFQVSLPVPVPEPASLGLLAIAATAGLTRRSRQ